MDTYNDISGTTSSNNIIDEPLRAIPLPYDHPISGLEELRKYSMSGNHRPFSAANKTTAGAEKGVVLAHNGKRPLNHLGLDSHHYTNLVAREWAERKVCWTIDLNGKRHAVQTTLGSSNGGGRGGAIFRIWQGKETKFDGPPIAFSISQTAQLFHKKDLDRKGRTSRIPRKNKTSNPVADRHGDKPPRTNRYPSRNHGDYANYCDSSEYSDSETEIAPSNYGSNYGSDLIERTSQRSVDESRYNGKRPWTESEHWRPASDSDAVGRTETDRNSFSQSRPSKVRLTMGSSSSHKAQTRKPEETVLSRSALSPGISTYESLPDSPAVADPTTTAKETTIPGRQNAPPVQSDRARLTTNSPLEAEQSKIPKSKYSLSPHKLENTVLLISMVNGPDETPIDLEKISTLDRFFDAVLDCSGTVGQEDSIESIRITCGWLSGRKPISITRKYPCAFQYFLKTVDKSPCWDKGEECEVEVVVTRK